MSGENLPLVGKLLGHRRHRTTAGYAHLADGHLVETVEIVGTIIAEAMAGRIDTYPEDNGSVRFETSLAFQPLCVQSILVLRRPPR